MSKCLVCGKKITGSMSVAYGECKMHFECWDDLVPEADYKTKDSKEIRKQKKDARLKEQGKKVFELIKKENGLV